MSSQIWKTHFSQVESWIEEAIWGHRVYDQATPELILLEFLNVVSSLLRNGTTPFEESQSTTASVAYRRSLVLRTILFNNPNLNTPIRQSSDESERWRLQTESLFKTWQGYSSSGNQTVAAYDVFNAESFSYLRSRFPDYETYVRLVNVLRESAVEYGSNKRWTSQFLFPYCDRALFEDLNDRTFSTDRRFFGRTGELAYIMLARSGSGSQVWDQLRPIVFNDSAPQVRRWDQVVRALMHPQDEAGLGQSSSDGTKLGYLPYESHEVFSMFAEDMIALLKVGMPEYDALPYLANLISFHLLHYVLTISCQGLPEGARTVYVVEIKGKANDVVRRLAKRQYKVNDELTLRRIEHELEQLRNSADIIDIFASKDPQRLISWFKMKCWRRAPDLPGSVMSEEAKSAFLTNTWEAFRRSVIKKHNGHLASVHHEFARQCGLSSRVGTNAYRYCLSDDFLRMLILANVPDRTEFRVFLDRLFDRYGFIISKQHAEALGIPLDLSAFDSNEERLRSRLSNLGLLQIQSDDCAYVINRYTQGGTRR